MQEYALHVSNRTLPSPRYGHLTIAPTQLEFHPPLIRCAEGGFADRWLLEDHSRSTRENAVNSIDIIADHRYSMSIAYPLA